MKSGIRKSIFLVLCLVSILFCLSGCGKDGEVDPTVPKLKFIRAKAEYLTVLMEEDDFVLLEDCPNLKYLNVSGSTCYDAILDYQKRHPEVQVVYTAPLGNQTLSNSETRAKLDSGLYSAEKLQKELKYLPNLKSLELPKISLSAQELQAIQSAWPNLEITYTVDLLGKELNASTATVDLSQMASDQMDTVIQTLPLLTELTDVTLSQQLTMVEVKSVMDQLPGTKIHYSFDLFGKTLSCADESVSFKDVKIGDEGEAQIRAALDILPQCTYFKLEDCGISNEVMASIRDDYPNTKIVWRVHFGGQYSVLTNEETMRTVYGVYNEHADILKYCTSLKYIDMGHNPDLTDISFIEYMPDLEIVILSGASMTDLDAFANHKKLEWLELANCYALNDISALESCDNLRFLNICFSKVTELTPIENLPLERFLYLNPKIDYETRKVFEENHPDCWVRFTGSDPYSLGWRYNDIGITMFDYYLKIRQIFDYDGVDRRVAAQEEAKRKEEEANKPVETTPPASETPPAESTPTPDPTPTPTPDPTPAPEPTPEPTPTPESTPTPEPTPTPTPEPTPTPDPAPES